MDLQLEQIEKQFDRAAKTYDSVASLQRKMADRLLAKLPDRLDGRLVDLGCGTGDLLHKVSQREAATQITGIDLSSAMLEKARQRVPEAQLIKGDLATLPFDDDSLACCISNAAIQWSDSVRVFSELRRVLQPGGKAFVSTFGPGTMQQWREVLSSVGEPERTHTFKPTEQLTKELSQAGFASVESSTETVDMHFASVGEMFDSIRKLGATNARRDRATGLSGRQWFERITQAFEERRNADGQLCVSYECIYLFAR